MSPDAPAQKPSAARRAAAVAGAIVALGVAALVGHQVDQPSSAPLQSCPAGATSIFQGGCTKDLPAPPGSTQPSIAKATGSNGNLSPSSLCPITGGVTGSIPGEGELLCGGPAASWNAMAVAWHARTGYWLQSDGSASAYRPYSVQVQLYNYWCDRGACQNAAYPGHSNHGLGTAVDNPPSTQTAIRTIGAQFHWNIGYGGCSDAPWEAWHAHYCGGYTGKDPGPYGNGGGGGGKTFRSLKLGDGGPRVRALNCRYLHLKRKGRKKHYATHGTRHYGPGMKTATQRFQRDENLGADGVYGPKTNSKMQKRWKRAGGGTKCGKIGR